MAAMAKAGLGQAEIRSQELLLGLCQGWHGPKLLGDPSLHSWARLHATRSEPEPFGSAATFLIF